MAQASPKRLLLYAHFDRDGQVDPHVLYQIKALWEYGLAVIFISNSPVSKKDAELLSPFIIDLRLRPDEGYDWGAWKEVLEDLGPEGLKVYDELILMNDSCYGPLFPLAELFDKMAETEADFWAITKNTDPAWNDHIQPYFCILKKTLLGSKDFWSFWRTLGKTSTFIQAIINGELRFTEYFQKAGWRYTVYADLSAMTPMPEIGLEHPYTYSQAPWLIRKYRVPFAKIKAFRTQFGKLFNVGPEFFSALSASGSLYPQQLIIDHIRRTKSLSWQKNLPGTLMVVDEKSPVLPDPGLRLAVFAHLFYPEQAREAIGWLNNIPYPFDLYITTSSQEKAECIEAVLTEQASSQIKKREIRLWEDRGRDVAPWLLAFRDLQDQYDLALKFHIKKSPHLPPAFVDEWNNFLMCGTLASPGYISKLLYCFKNEKRLGILFHSFPPVLSLVLPYIDSPGDIIEKEKLLTRLDSNAPEETSYSIFSQNIFWYRPQAMEALLSSDIQVNEFPTEPCPHGETIAHGLERVMAYIAQGHGYFYKLVIPQTYLASSFQHYEDFIWHLHKAGYRKICQNLSAPVLQNPKISYNYYLSVEPGKIPIARLFQIACISLSQHALKKLKKLRPNTDDSLKAQGSEPEQSYQRYLSGAPGKIPLARLFQIMIISLYRHSSNKAKKAFKSLFRRTKINSAPIAKYKIKKIPSNPWISRQTFIPMLPPELANIEPSQNLEPELTVILPSTLVKTLAGGPNTILRFAAELAKHKVNIHCLSLNTPADSDEALRNHLVTALGVDKEAAARFRSSSLGSSTESLTISQNSKIMATASWTMPAARVLAERSKSGEPAYFIQDFEPFFWPWGAEHAALMESYAGSYLPIINTPSLARALFNIGAGSLAHESQRQRALVFSPAVDRQLFYPQARSEGQKKLLIYTRPGPLESRNLYPVAMEAVSRLAKAGLLTADRWQLECYGAPDMTPIDFGNGLITTVLGSLDMAAYAAAVRQTDLILYLVLSPHTGYMTLEAAACGVPVITNTYLNKSERVLKDLSANIIPAAPVAEAIMEALRDGLDRAESYKPGEKGRDDLKSPATWAEAFAPILPKTLSWMSV